MSYLTYAARRLFGDTNYEEFKGRALGAGLSSAVAALPQDNGQPPKAILEHRVTLTQWQPLAVGAAILLITYYVLSTQR